ncbi:MAG: Uma2 family endonuclease [Trichormus sp. ATA11-4-KO1]|jgi:Uma2 family endonuclease|nr:Uma2 family endonuclease [Trichormus sp. ATA11-4-KO1]
MVISNVRENLSTDYSLENWLQSPPEGTEWVNGELLEKEEVTLKHSRIQANIATYWRNYKETSGQGGEVYTEVPCLTNQRGRRPDVAYLTPELMQQFGEPAVLPQSFPLIAEIISPTDLAEDMIAKSQEYLQFGSEEVWLVFPENSWIIVITKNQRLVFISGEVVRTQVLLAGFNIAVDELLG